jgi:transposase
VRQQVRQWVQEQPDLTLAELAERLCNATGIRASVPTLCRVLQQLDLPRKKNPSMPPSAIPRKFARRASTTENSLPGARSND